MGGLLWSLRDASLLLTIPLSGLIYLLALILLGTFSEEEVTLFRSLLSSDPRKIKPASDLRSKAQ